ncbi:MAG: hypothetical protein RLZZ248_1779 [Bacteroidota bacterium]|jgi:NADPH-dependent 2,4-dienoyl-CoA reductase/sulfur reductase-like enzyme
MKKIVILGNGIAGVQAAITIRQNSEAKILLISEERSVFFARTAMMYVFMGQLSEKDITPYPEAFFKANQINLLHASISSVDVPKNILITSDNQAIPYDLLLIATGSKPNIPDWATSKCPGIHNFYHWQDLTSLKSNIPASKQPIVIGGGLIASELVEMMEQLNRNPKLLVRESYFGQHFLPKEEGLLVHEVFRQKGISLFLNTSITSLIPPSEDGTSYTLNTENGQTFSTDFIGLGTGVLPNIDFLKDSPLRLGRGILVNNQMQTNIENIYAAGDCAELNSCLPNRKTIEANWYVAKSMGEIAGKNIVGNPTNYQQGIWHNTAKFFNLEYHLCGDVPLKAKDNFGSYFYKNSKYLHSLRLAFNQSTNQLSGVLSMGLRIDYSLLKNWLEEGISIEMTLKNLPSLSYQNKLGFFPSRNLLKEVKYEY